NIYICLGTNQPETCRFGFFFFFYTLYIYKSYKYTTAEANPIDSNSFFFILRRWQNNSIQCNDGANTWFLRMYRGNMIIYIFPTNRIVNLNVIRGPLLWKLLYTQLNPNRKLVHIDNEIIMMDIPIFITRGRQSTTILYRFMMTKWKIRLMMMIICWNMLKWNVSVRLCLLNEDKDALVVVAVVVVKMIMLDVVADKLTRPRRSSSPQFIGE
ncbi:hypothetical protein BLOT_015103, partial [Blomia tropicalis]